MTDFESLKQLIVNSEFTKRDMKKIENMILNDIRKEVNKQVDEFMITRCFIQLNQE